MQNPRNHSYLAAFGIFGLSLAVVAFFARDVPNADDFDLFLNFVNQFVFLDSFFDRLKLIFAPHNEHVHFLNRLAALVQLNVLGSLNFWLLIIFGLSGLIICVFGFWYLFRAEVSEDAHYNFLSLVLLLSSPVYVSATQWATTAISTFWMFSFGFLAILYAKESGLKGLFVSTFFAVCSSLAMASGFAVWGALIVFYFIRKLPLRAFFSCCCMFSLYFLFFSSSVSRSGGAIELEKLVDFFIMLAGSAFAFGNEVAAFWIGCTVLLLFAGLTVSGSFNRAPIAWSSALFCLGIVFAISFGRSGLNMDFAYTIGRYRYISLWYTVFVLSLLFESGKEFWQKKGFLLTLPLAAVLFLSAFAWSHADYRIRYQGLADSSMLWTKFRGGLWHPSTEHAAKILQESEALGVYSLAEQGMYSRMLECPKNLLNTQSVAKIDDIYESADFLSLLGYSFLRDGPSAGLVRLKGERRVYCFQVQNRIREDVYKHFHPQAPRDAGFFILIDKSELPKGEYALEFMFGKSGVWMTHSTTRKFRT